MRIEYPQPSEVIVAFVRTTDKAHVSSGTAKPLCAANAQKSARQALPLKVLGSKKVDQQ